MNLTKLLNAVKHIDQVYEGVKNNIWKKDYVEDIANDRWQICTKCDKFDKHGQHCAAPGSQPCCADCGCSLGLKLRSLSSSCPKGKWKAVVNSAADTVVTGCNFCYGMMNQGLKPLTPEGRSEIQVKDVADIVSENLVSNSHTK